MTRLDLVACQACRTALAVPSLEHLRQGTLDFGWDAQSLGDGSGGLAVSGHRFHDLAQSTGHEAADLGGTLQRPVSREMPEQEAHHRQPGPVHLVAGRPHLRVVAEPA